MRAGDRAYFVFTRIRALIATPRVFITASHCTDLALSQGFTETRVTFDPNFGTDPDHNIFSTPYHGTMHQRTADGAEATGFRPVFATFVDS